MGMKAVGLWTVCFSVIASTLAVAAGMPAEGPTPAWSVEGRWADACSCMAPCPCWRREVPNAGSCGDLFYFHIDKGHYGDLTLDGLDVVQIFKTPEGKTMAQSRKDRDVAIANTYLSRDLPPALAAALESIFVRMSPTQSSSARSHATKRVPLQAAMGSERVTIDIPGVLAVELAVTRDSTGMPQPFPYAMKAIPWTVPGAVQAHSIVYDFRDDHLSWKIRQRNATFARFSYSSDRGLLPWEPGFTPAPSVAPTPGH